VIKDTNESTEEQVQFLDSAEAFRAYIRSQTRWALSEVFDQELSSLCGERYEHSNANSHYRAGSAPSYVMTEAGREPMQRPRVRKFNADGSDEEVALSS